MDVISYTGSALVAVWSLARVYFWWRARGRKVALSRMTFARRALLVVVSLTLVPIYLYYFTGILGGPWRAWPDWVRVTGTLILAAGIWVFVWSHLALGRNWTVDVSLSEGQRLVVEGPYRLVRHPMYGSLLLMAVGFSLASGHPLVGPPFGVAVAVLYWERVEVEEHMMLGEFGDSYASYVQRTGRLMPRVGRRGRG